VKDESDVPGRLEVHASPEARTRGYLVSIVIDVLLLYCAQHVLEWNLPWVTSAWADVLWAVNLSLVASIAGNALLLVNDALWIKRVVDVMITGFALVAAYWMYVLFPFDLGAWSAVAQLAALGVLLALGIAMFVLTILAAVEVAREGWRHVLAVK
jgi:hypothetical protein